MKTFIAATLVIAILAILLVIYLASHGQALFVENLEKCAKTKDVASGSDVNTKTKKFSRITSKSPAIDVFEYIYTKFYRPKK